MANSRSNLSPARIIEVDDKGSNKTDGISVKCMFNPFEYTVSKTNSYEQKSKNRSDVPQVEFKGSGPQVLKLSLVFDTFETKENLTETTRKLWKLMESKTRSDSNKNKKVPPPEVAFEWGIFRFVAVITEMSQKFILFNKEGTPVRAKVDITFTQHKDLEDYKKTNPTSGGGEVNRVWRVTSGDRLDLIAYSVYGDATKWRRIAEANKILDPLRITPGLELLIPEE